MPRVVRTILHGLGLFCFASFLSSCATIFSASRFTVPIRSEPTGADVTILDRDSAIVYQGHTPAIVRLRSSQRYFKRGIYTVHITAPDHEPYTQQLRSNISGWYWGNVFIGGALGMLIVDPLTGCMYSLNHRYILGQLHTTSALPAE